MRPVRLRGCSLTLALMLALTGCSHLASNVGGDEPGDRWHNALQLLGDGEEERAEQAFAELLDVAGYRERAEHMLEQIRRPVHRYFPGDHFNVRLRAGQTLSALSRRYLDDPLKFFALARYNGITAPGEVATGQLIRIPLTEHARRVRTAEMGSPEADDRIDQSAGMGTDNGTAAGGEAGVDHDPGTAGATGSSGEGSDDGLSDAERERIRRYYREATVAFQQQDLERTLRYCERVLQLDTDHENCRGYRDRARALQRRLDRIKEDDQGAER